MWMLNDVCLNAGQEKWRGVATAPRNHDCERFYGVGGVTHLPSVHSSCACMALPTSSASSSDEMLRTTESYDLCAFRPMKPAWSPARLTPRSCSCVSLTDSVSCWVSPRNVVTDTVRVSPRFKVAARNDTPKTAYLPAGTADGNHTASPTESIRLKIGRAHVGTPVTNATIGCRLPCVKQK